MLSLTKGLIIQFTWHSRVSPTLPSSLVLCTRIVFLVFLFFFKSPGVAGAEEASIQLVGCCQNPNLGADKLRWVSRSEEDESLLFDFLTLLSLVLVCLLSKSELWCSRKVGQSRRGVDDECWIKRIVVITCSQTRFSYLSRTLNSYTWLVAQLQIWMIVFANTC